MAYRTSQFLIDEDEPKQMDPIYLSSEEDTESQYSISYQELRGDNDPQCQTLNQVVVHGNDPTEATQVTFPTNNVNMTTPSPSAANSSKAQLNSHTYNVSPATRIHYS